MASEKTLYSSDGKWKVKVEAWKNNFIFYSSIGTQVDVYHKETTKNVWGNSTVEWVKKPATRIFIRNVYTGSLPGSIVREKTCSSAKHCEQKEWAAGLKITISDGSASAGGFAPMIVDKVEGSVSVMIGSETLTAEVSASGIISDSSIW